MTGIAFVCQGNAGRSQLAMALAERERERRELGDCLDLVTGGVDPNDHVHEEVRHVLAEADVDIGDRKPRLIRPNDVADVDHIVTMGCEAAEFTPPDWNGTSEQWDLDHPGGDLESVRAQRDEIAVRVVDLFDRLELGT